MNRKKKIFLVNPGLSLLLVMLIWSAFGFFLSQNISSGPLPTPSRHGNQLAKIIILCFDDGPRPWVLEKLLPILKRHNAAGTFFMVGEMISANKKVVKAMHDAGYEIENHSWDHKNFKKLLKNEGPAAIKANVERCAEAIFKATGRQPKFFRPPYEAMNDEIEKIITGMGYTVMKADDPDIDTEDYVDYKKHRPPEILIARVKNLIANQEKLGSFNHVLVFHEWPITAEALDTLIPYFQSQGYKFIRLDER